MRGSVEILELGGVTAYPKTVTCDEELLPAAEVTETCMQLATPQVPPYSSKFSKRTFTQPQLMTLYCLKIKLGVTYRDLIGFLRCPASARPWA